MIIFFNTKELLYKSQHRLTLIITKNTPKKLTSLEHKIFDIMRCIKFLPGKKTIQSPGKTNCPRRAILFDPTSDIGKTIWRDLTQSIEEGRKYEFHNLNVKIFLGKKLSTTPTTTAFVKCQSCQTILLKSTLIMKKR